MPLPVRSRRAGFDSVEPSADRLGQGARYLSDAGGVKGMTGEFFPRCELSSRSRDKRSVGLGSLSQLAHTVRVELGQLIGGALPRAGGRAADRQPAPVRGPGLARRNPAYPPGE